ncbi:hypothetical protein [Sediminicola luteus]|uniref:Lycopene cyclase domain-containing protein n=1 Tax=Sediminicola luteus TaxID=319238 RepID=A0ABV2TXS0_9FLAO
MIDFLKNNFNKERSSLLLFIFLTIDIVFIVIHLLIALFWDSNPKEFRVDEDGGYPEIFQYFKYILIVLITFYLVAKRSINYLPWLILFLFLCFDDALQFHEKAGIFFANFFSLQSYLGLRAIDLGELVFAFLMGLILFLFSFKSYFQGSKIFKNNCVDILSLFTFFLFFGIGIDMVHQLFAHLEFVAGAVALIEDGGEMITLSLLVWYFYFIVLETDVERRFLYNYFYSKKEVK